MVRIRQRVVQGIAALALALPLVGFSTLSAQAGAKSPPPAYDVTFENISTEFLSVKLRLPKIEIKGSNIAKADIEKLFSQDATTSFAERLKPFTAATITIPAADFEFKFGPIDGKGSYQGIVFENIAGGLIGKTAVASISAQYSVKDVLEATVIAKPMVFNEFNLAHLLHVWNDKAGADEKDLKPLWGTGSIDGLSIKTTAPTGNGTAEYGKLTILSGPKVRALSRPLKEIVNDGVNLALTLANKGAASDPAIRGEQLNKLHATLSGAVEFAENYVPDSYTIDAYKAEEMVANLIKVTVEIAHLQAGSGHIQLDNITFSALDNKVKIGKASLEGFSLEPTIAAAKVFLAKPIDSFDEKELSMLAQRLQPNWGTFNFRDIDVDVTVPKSALADEEDDEDSDDEEDTEEATPAPEQPAAQNQNIKFKIKDVTVKAEKPFNGIPTAFRLAISNFQSPVAQLTTRSDARTQELLKQLAALGYVDANLTYVVDLSWDKSANELAINEVRIADETLGSFVLGGTIGNFTEDMFSGKTALIQATAIGLLAKNVSLHVEDRGLLDRFAKLKADELGMTVEQWKSSFAQMLMLIPPDIAELNSVKTLKTALLNFWNKPGTLDVAVKAKNGAGLGLADFIAISQAPASIEPKIELKAESK